MEHKDRNQTPPSKRTTERSEFLDSLQKGALIGGALLLLILPPLRMGMQQQQQANKPAATAQAPAAQQKQQQQQPPAVAQAPAPAQGGGEREQVAQAPAAAQDGTPATADASVAAQTQAQPPAQDQQVAKAPEAKAPALPLAPPKLAQFGPAKPSPDVQLVANWSVATQDHKKSAFVVVDKKDARVYVFSPDGKLKGETAVLLGSAVGDDSVPGIGDKPLSQVKPSERTTPAGRFIAEIGMNARNEDVVWVDYDAAVSMHRVLRTPEAIKKDKRLVRLNSPTAADNRISYGCINVPVPFFEKVLAPTVRSNGAVIYVLPETRSLQKQFPRAYDPTARLQVAQVSHKQVQQ